MDELFTIDNIHFIDFEYLLYENLGEPSIAYDLPQPENLPNSTDINNHIKDILTKARIYMNVRESKTLSNDDILKAIASINQRKVYYIT
jgi:hypothetical protein